MEYRKAFSRFSRRSLPLALALALAVTTLSGCNSIARTIGSSEGLVRVGGSGNVITREMDFKDFSEVEVTGAFNADLTRGDGFAVAITADDNLFDHFDIYQQGQTLHIGMKRGIGIFGSNTYRAKVTMPNLRRAEFSGASRGTIAGFKSSNGAEFEVSGASRLTGRLDAGTVRVKASGASHVELGGAASNLEVEVSGASRAELGDLPVTDARAIASGASTAVVNANGRLDADASGASTVAYVGNPALGKTSTSGASSIKRR